jgi:hypothetical protein
MMPQEEGFPEEEGFHIMEEAEFDVSIWCRDTMVCFI